MFYLNISVIKIFLYNLEYVGQLETLDESELETDDETRVDEQISDRTLNRDKDNEASSDACHDENNESDEFP